MTLYSPTSPISTIRRRIAGWFGRHEHFAGELLGVVLLIEVSYFQTWQFIIPFTIWLVYFISHRLEKKVYGKYGYR